MLRTHRSLEGLLYNPLRKMMKIFLLFHFNGAPVECKLQSKTDVLGEKPVPLPLCPTQIPHGPTRDRTAVRGRRLTACAMARPSSELRRILHLFVHVWITFHIYVYPLQGAETSRDGKSFSANHEIPRILWNLNVHYRVHNSPPFVPVLRQINASWIHIIQSKLNFF
jgi:hypothetical protein